MNKDWYKASYIHTQNWILENYGRFGITSSEGIVLLMIDFLNENRDVITLDFLAQKCNMSTEDVDQALSVLVSKGFLSIKATAKGIKFDLTGLFNMKDEVEIDPMATDTYDLFENEFARPLKKNELQMISEWLLKYDKKLIVYALREASMYKKMNFNYIQRILMDWKEKGYDAAHFEQNDD